MRHTKSSRAEGTLFHDPQVRAVCEGTNIHG